jgi:DNA replication protein DnaC
MLPLGDAARSYVEAIAPRRRTQRDAAADAEAADDAADAESSLTDARRAHRAERRVGARPAESLAPDVCPICRGVGYVRADAPVGDPAFGQALPCVCKERQLEERRRSDLWRISSLAPFEKKTFETYEGAVTPGVREAFEVARRYADDPQGWLILSGGYGVGKTHLAAAIANHHLARGGHVFFSIVPDLLDHLRAAFAPSSESPFDEMFDRVREAGLLVLDDLGAENGTAWATEKLFQLINYRYNFRMPTVITTNHRLLSHMDERIRSRLSDLSLARHVAIDAPDYRERHSGRTARPTPRPTANGRGRP